MAAQGTQGTQGGREGSGATAGRAWFVIPQAPIDGLRLDGMCSVAHKPADGNVTYVHAEIISPADAEHIVRCVNAHEGLVNVNQALKLALMELMNHVEADPRDDHCWVCGALLASDYPAAEGQHLPNCAWESAHAALALARGE